MSVTLIGFIGTAAGFVSTITFLPQVIKIWRTKSAKDLSSLTLFFLFPSCCKDTQLKGRLSFVELPLKIYHGNNHGKYNTIGTHNRIIIYKNTIQQPERNI